MPLLGQTLARWAWSGLLGLMTPVYLARLWWRGRAEPGYRLNLAQRLGWAYGPPCAASPLWVHAVSLGETKAATALVLALRERLPGVPLLLTHGTATGHDAGKSLLQPGDAQTWLPWDTAGATRRFLRHWQPRLGVLMETEIWPSLQHSADAVGLPMVLANARLSARSARKGQRLRVLLRPAAQALHLALAQSDADAARLREAGVRQVRTCGNLKYDLRPDAAELAVGAVWKAQWAQAGRRVVVVANTRDGEELALLKAWQAWRSTLEPAQPSTLVLAIVPRHPQRFDEVARLVQAHGETLVRRSDLADDQLGEEGVRCGVFLGDSLGEMARYYGMAELALLGGSFAPLGGHNLIESAACACPIILGPSTFNFAEAASLALAAGAAWQVSDWDQAWVLAGQLLAQPQACAQARRAAEAFASAHRGAAERMADDIVGLLGFTSPAGR